MNILEKIQLRNRALWVVIFLVALVGTVMVAKAFSGSAQNVTENGNINVTNNFPAGTAVKMGGEDVMIGAAVAGDATHLSQEPKPTAFGSTYFSSDVEVDGTTYLDGPLTTVGLTTLGSTTVGYATNLLNTPQVAFNGNTTTPCSVQNTSGVNRVITSLTLGITGSTGDGAITAFRGYVSAGRADANTRASSTLMKTTIIPVTATDLLVFGGPVPSSYYVTSSPTLLNALGSPSTTPVLWPIGWYANVTSTAIASSTGDCIISSFPL